MASSDALERVRTLAREFASQRDAVAAAAGLLVETTCRAGADELARTVQAEAVAALDATPAYALGLARIAHALAQNQTAADLTAATALTLARALNRLGEFRAAQLSAETVAASARAPELRARAECEIAWAQLFIGGLSDVTARAHATPELAAHGDWRAGLVARDHSDYPHAAEMLGRARDFFVSAAQPLEAARCARDLAYVAIRCDDAHGVAALRHLRETFLAAGCRFDAARCDSMAATWWLEHDRPKVAHRLLMQARTVFVECRADFFVALCDNDLGWVHRAREQFEPAERCLCRARDYFRAQQMNKFISTTAINLGNVYYVWNRYEDALTLYRQAADLALGEGRATRAARVWNNMAMAHTKLGRYDQALDLYQRALQIIADKDQALLAAGIHAMLAACYRDLGQTRDALRHLRVAEQTYGAADARLGKLSIQLALVEAHLACGEKSPAAAHAKRARALAVAEQVTASVAWCDRVLAQTVTRHAERPRALKRLASARARFAEQNKPVDVALCDLIEGELCRAWDMCARARAGFERARAALVPHLPDYAWRVEHGLAHCALAEGAPATAFAHWQNAVRLIADTRGMAGTEQFSNAYFARRHAVYDDALALAVTRGAAEPALDIIEASKARAFLALLRQRGWQLARARDPYVAGLIMQERALREKLAQARARMLTPLDDPPVRGAAPALPAEVEQLAALGDAYEQVVTQLRLATPGLAGAALPAPFALSDFCAAMTRAHGDDWCALDYALSETRVVIVSVTPRATRLIARELSPRAAHALAQCAALEPDLRELVYRGTLRGVPAPSQGKRDLQALYRLLIPDGALANTLIIAPHGALHALPFHALMDGETYLAEKCAIVYAPSLQVAQQLAGVDASPPASVLAFGLGEFGAMLPRLPNAESEAQTTRALWQTGELRLGRAATRAELLRLNASGALRAFDVIHLATHALLDRAAPHQSRVLLADEPLTVFDVLGLSLNARLVTLSACQTALGKGGAGDEWVGLTRAFFYAGARALLATLWHVEDDSTSAMVARVYAHLARGEAPARALQRAQIEMLRAGHSPYQWAAFALVGSG